MLVEHRMKVLVKDIPCWKEKEKQKAENDSLNCVVAEDIQYFYWVGMSYFAVEDTLYYSGEVDIQHFVVMHTQNFVGLGKEYFELVDIHLSVEEDMEYFEHLGDILQLSEEVDIHYSVGCTEEDIQNWLMKENRKAAPCRVLKA